MVFAWSDPDASRTFPREFLLLLHLFGRDGVRPGIAETEFRGGFLGGEFAGRFNDRTNRITHFAGELPVGMIDSPELITRFGVESLRHIHGRS